MFRRWAAIGFLFILVCGVGVAASSPGSVEAARWVYVPHNCAEWEPIAHEERNIAILETLGVHRGQALYCGIDQSDTFAKAETWEIGQHHNQRDDTVYWGENGNFFGFTACQEGWLTEGESGLTGCGIHSIFEFPRERVRDRDSGRQLYLRYGRTYTTKPGATTNKYSGGKERVQSSGVLGPAVTFIYTPWVRGEEHSQNQHGSNHADQADESARAAFNASEYATPEGMLAMARDGIDTTVYPQFATVMQYIGADAECRELGYQRARSINAWRQAWPDRDSITNNLRQVPQTGWLGTRQGEYSMYQYRARIFYEATCWKP